MVGICCHDAGAAELISSYVLQHKLDHQFTFSLSGPSVEIFEKKLGILKNYPIDSMIQKSDQIFCGTGWNKFEITAMIKARNMKKYLVVFLDHWVNYKERFEYKGNLILPDEIWVSDIYAKNLALKLFKSVKIKLIENYFLNDIKEKYKRASFSHRKKSNNQKILFLSDNNNSVIDSGFVKDSTFICRDEEIAEYFLNNIRLVVEDISQIVIRPHPSETQVLSKYKSIFDQYKIPFIIGGKTNLLEEISCSEIVVGADSMALVVAMVCGKKTYTCTPPNASYTLPFKEIQQLRKIKEKM